MQMQTIYLAGVFPVFFVFRCVEHANNQKDFKNLEERICDINKSLLLALLWPLIAALGSWVAVVVTTDKLAELLIKCFGHR